MSNENELGRLPYHGTPPCVAASDTSRSAADRIRGKANDFRQQVLRYIIECGQAGCTDEQCQLALGLKVQTETPRRGELVKMGLVSDSGRRRPTSSGRLATVWIASTAASIGGTDDK